LPIAAAAVVTKSGPDDLRGLVVPEGLLTVPERMANHFDTLDVC